MNIAELLVRGAQQAPNRPAIAVGETSHSTYRELLERVDTFAAGLRNRGLQSGDRVAIFAGNCPQYIEVMLAVWWLGAVIVPINAKLARPELDVILDQADPALLFVGGDTQDMVSGLDYVRLGSAAFYAFFERAERTSGAPTPRAADDLAWLFFTSGTTGTPKGAMITHGNLYAMVQGYFTDVDPIPEGAALIHFAPLSHGSGIYLLPFLARSGVSVCGPTPRMMPDILFELVRAWPEACLFAAPTIINRLTQAAAASTPDLTNLRTIVAGGGPLYLSDLKAAFAVLGPVLAQIYGQGESPMTITAQSRTAVSRALAEEDDAYLSTVGRAFVGTEVRIVDPGGHPLGLGQTGEIIVRSATVVAGYWRRPQATAETIRDGWLWTGDLGRLDARGCLTLDGRSKETVITGGSNVYPIEVEAVLLQHPDVAEAAIVGEPDSEWGEIVVAHVVMREPVALGGDIADLDVTGSGGSVAPSHSVSDMLDAHCRRYLARFKCPKRYQFHTDLPKNAYGKVAKRELQPCPFERDLS